MKPSKVVVLTGGMGSGKSTVARILSEEYPVFSADEISREVIHRPEIVREISEKLTGRYFTDGKLDRRAFGRYVFSDPARTETLNRIMHGAIYRELQRRIDDCDSELVFAEIPLYYEDGERFPCEEVWVVTADEEIRLARAMFRDGLSEGEARGRMSRQIKIEKIESAHTVIENNGDERSLRRAVSLALSHLRRK